MKPNRQSHRLRGYDYTQPGAYFITLCTKNKDCLFGEIHHGKMDLNEYGNIVQECWYDLPNHYPTIELDSFVVMPNHIHGIVILKTHLENRESADSKCLTMGNRFSDAGAGFKPAPASITPVEHARPFKYHGLPEIVRALKTFSARRINILRDMRGVPVWQRNYHEHIIRRGTSLNRIQRYILMNPLKWEWDRENSMQSS